MIMMTLNIFCPFLYRNWNGHKRRKSVICVQSDLWVGTNYSYLTPFIFPNSWLRSGSGYSISFDAHRSYGLCGTGIQLYLWYVYGHWVRNSLILSKKSSVHSFAFCMNDLQSTYHERHFVHFSFIPSTWWKDKQEKFS